MAGSDYFKIMALSGHRTMSVFKRYGLVTEEELSQIRWLEKKKKTSQVGTKAKKAPMIKKGLQKNLQPLDMIW
jgi:hypothetical protein